MISSSQTLACNVSSISNRTTYTNHVKDVVEGVYRLFAAIEGIDKNNIKTCIDKVRRSLMDVNEVRSLEKLPVVFKVLNIGLLLLALNCNDWRIITTAMCSFRGILRLYLFS